MRLLSKCVWLSLMVFPALVWAHAAPASQCDSTYVIRNGKTLKVNPIGTDDADDTANIQCAFDRAVRIRGARVKLIEGTYRAAQILVRDFVGTFEGAGKTETVVENPLNIEVTVSGDDFFLYEPSAEFTWPSIFIFLGGDFRVSDMTIRAVGDPNDPDPNIRPTTGWSIYGLPTTYELAHALVVLGTKAHVVAKRMLVEGQEADGTLFGYNVINGIYPQGDVAGTLGIPMKGSLVVNHSTFRNIGFGVPFGSVKNYRASVRYNTFENVFGAVDVADISYTGLVFADNEVDALVGANFYNFAPDGVFPDGIASSRILIRDNQFSGGDAVVFDVPFLEDVRCRLIDNDVSEGGIGLYPGQIFLGPGTKNCLVKGSGPDARIEDRGSNNVIVP